MDRRFHGIDRRKKYSTVSVLDRDGKEVRFLRCKHSPQPVSRGVEEQGFAEVGAQGIEKDLLAGKGLLFGAVAATAGGAAHMVPVGRLVG